ncbi:fibronectin type III domain-containing protein [Cellulosimicrobium sp. ES-005]|uniref:Fibronectin type III domain-containing protein n=1 Tax=Cellulosimicrobium sp. ES-005 TaxID=3163031 RepID=A0AAU8FZL0_9MICO
MAITWGAVQRNLAVGIDIIMSPGSVGAGTTAVTITVNYYVRAFEAYHDDQTMNLTGGFYGPVNYRLDSNNGTTTDRHIASRTFTANTSYSGGPTYTFGAYLTGVYNGVQPSHSRSITVPARPPSPPNTSGNPTFSNVTSSNIRVTSAVPGNNGAAIVEWQFQRATNAAFTAGVATYSHNGHILDISGLAPATTYYFRVRSRNAAGWAGWSATGSRATLAAAPGAMAAPTITDVLPTEARATFAAPSNGGSAITRYEVQTSANTSYSPALTHTGSSPLPLTGLDPGQKHFARVRAVNAVGAGPWSGSSEFTTLSGSAVKVDGIWRSAKTYVKVDGTWRLAKVHKKVEGVWRL